MGALSSSVLTGVRACCIPLLMKGQSENKQRELLTPLQRGSEAHVHVGAPRLQGGEDAREKTHRQGWTGREFLEGTGGNQCNFTPLGVQDCHGHPSPLAMGRQLGAASAGGMLRA